MFEQKPKLPDLDPDKMLGYFIAAMACMFVAAAAVATVYVCTYTLASTIDTVRQIGACHEMRMPHYSECPPGTRVEMVGGDMVCRCPAAP